MVKDIRKNLSLFLAEFPHSANAGELGTRGVQLGRLSVLWLLNRLCEDLFAELSQCVSLKASQMNIPLRECFKKLPIIAVGCLLHSLFKIQLAGECPIVITTYCDNPHMKGKMDLELGDGLQ